METRILCSIQFLRKSCSLWDNAERYDGAREAADDNMATRFMLDK
jgi:hypothetical protein